MTISKLSTASGFGKVLQVVRATDTTLRTTSSTTFVDANISVTITPQKNTSAILLIWTLGVSGSSFTYAQFQITDNSNNAISGANGSYSGTLAGSNNAYALCLIGYATPATTSATTYKGRYRTDAGSIGIYNNTHSTGQLYAIEVAA